ncbi:hypothetical protein ACWD5B_35750 [Streptomyces tanashiensis]|uniref:hypothetical protein n=1 Tax=Streptomyces tanashiensis TaxID=67367 RepID=UPI00367E2629
MHAPRRGEFHLDGWTQGLAWGNGFPLGRSWSRDPQAGLSVPAPVLRAGTDEITVLELHAATTRRVHLRDRPDLGATEE